MKKKLIAGLTTGFFMMVMAGMAQAILIDFTSDTWEFVNGNNTESMTVDGIAVKLEAMPTTANLTWNGTEGPGNIDIGNGVVLAGDGDGIGILDDEIQNGEMLKVSFIPDVIVNEIYLLDLFSGEKGIYEFDDDGNFILVEGGNVDWGFLSIVTGNSDSTSWVTFSTPENSGNWDYAVAGMDVDVAPVPEPSTMLLMGSGLLGLVGYSRKRFSKKS